jgi:hypothetical protein
MSQFIETFLCSLCKSKHSKESLATDCFNSHELKCFFCKKEIVYDHCMDILDGAGIISVEFNYGSCYDGYRSIFFICDECAKSNVIK